MRQGTLIITGAIAALSLVLAIVTIWGEMRSVKPEAGGPLFPGIEDELYRVAAIRITSATGDFTLTRNEDDQWVMPEKAGYPVDIDKARSLAAGFADAVKEEAKTAEPSLYPQIGVGDVPGDALARQVELLDESGNAIATLIVGKSQTGGLGPERRFVRIAGEERSWLASGLEDVPDRAADWLDPTFISIAPARVMSVVVEHPEEDETGKDVEIYKDSPDERHFKVRRMPDTHVMRSDGAADPLGNALASVRFEDVVPAEDRPDDLPVTTVRYRTFDGLVLTLNITGTDGNHWVEIAAGDDPDLRRQFEDGDGAAAIPASPDLDAEIAGINRRHGGWAYRLPRFKALDLLKYQHSFIEPETVPENP